MKRLVPGKIRTLRGTSSTHAVVRLEGEVDRADKKRSQTVQLQVDRDQGASSGKLLNGDSQLLMIADAIAEESKWAIPGTRALVGEKLPESTLSGGTFMTP